MTIPSLLLLALLPSASQRSPSAPQAERPFALMVGDPAPALEVAEWVQGKPVARFEPGQTYVVEFWATWCGPCKKAIPHLNELSKQYAGKAQFIGVSVFEHLDDGQPYAVPKFVQEMGDKMTYTVASDQIVAGAPQPMSKKWMDAAGQNTIPTTFVVDGKGRVAWIGYPLQIDGVLSEVVAGTYDVDAAARKYATEMRVKGLSAKLQKDISKAKKDKDFAGAVRVIDEAIAADPALEASFGLDKYFLLLDAKRASDAAAYGQRLVSQVIGDNPNALNKLAWTIVDPQAKAEGDYALAVLAAERAVKLEDGKNAMTLDTYGLALFRAGKVDRAIEVQTKAVALVEGEDYEQEFRARLEEFQKAKKNL